jgi:predicted nucleic acid-binding protein
MSSICLIDTSVFVNLLNVPNLNQDYQSVMDNFKNYAESGYTFLLPMATIIETGNHIAHNGNGDVRRQTAERFVKEVKAAFNEEAPWILSQFPQAEDILLWIDQFPDLAGKNKIQKKEKEKEGTSFADLSIIQEYKKACAIFHMGEVFIWSTDSDLKTYLQLAKKL